MPTPDAWLDPRYRERLAHYAWDHGEWCWCQPRVEQVLPEGEVVIHKRFMDQADG